LNSARINPVKVAMAPRTTMQSRPGARPRVARTWGSAVTLRLTLSASIRRETCHLITLALNIQLLYVESVLPFARLGAAYHDVVSAAEDANVRGRGNLAFGIGGVGGTASESEILL
jgi:hypothetical protein